MHDEFCLELGARESLMVFVYIPGFLSLHNILYFLIFPLFFNVNFYSNFFG